MIDRYKRAEMARIWTEENKFKAYLEVEILSCEAWQQLGVIPKEDVDKIRQNAKFNIERIYEITQQFAEKGNRWYDSDPVMLKAIELLRVAPPQTQRIAALKLLLAMESNDMESLEKEDDE